MHSFYNAFLLHNEADHGKVNQELDSVQHDCKIRTKAWRKTLTTINTNATRY